MKTILSLRNIFALILVMTLHSCSNDDTDIQDTDYAISYAEFNISGPITNGDYEYRDVSIDDEFTASGYFYPEEEDTDNQIQLYIGKSLTESNFLLVAPNEIGTHNIVLGGGNDFDVSIKLVDYEDNFYAKAVTVIITDLEIESNIVKYCKGTFSGSFYRINLEEADVHQINDGEFEFFN